jgi:hypothetical protein
MPFGPPIPIDGLSKPDRIRAERFNAFQSDGLGYLHLQSTRPATLGYCLSDSPLSQLAWILEKFHEWSDPAEPLPSKKAEWDQLLTIASIFWFRNAGASSAHAVYEGMRAFRQLAAGGPEQQPTAFSQPPSGVAVFAADTTIRSVMDPNRTFVHWAEFKEGGHFPAMETPDLLVPDLRRFFREYRRPNTPAE